jgi:hypothetical protein
MHFMVHLLENGGWSKLWPPFFVFGKFYEKAVRL